MTLSSAPTAQYGFAFGDGTAGNQWLFGGAGQGVQVLQVEGLESIPDIRSQDTSRGYSDGSYTGQDFLNARSVIFTLQIMGDAATTVSSFQTYLGELRQYLLPQRSGVSVLQVYIPGRPVMRLYGRVRRRNITLDPDYTYGRAVASVEFFCPDPRLYSDLLKTDSATGAVPNTRVYNRFYNLKYLVTPPPGTVAAANLVATNDGTYETWPVFTSTGSASFGLKITNTSTQEFLSFPQLSLSASDTLVIDTDTKTVLLNGSPARNYLSVTSRWSSIPESSTTTFKVSSVTGTPTCSVSFRDAYI